MVDAIPLAEGDVYVIPAKSEQTYDKMWIASIQISTPSPLAEGWIEIRYFPMNSEGEVVRADSQVDSLEKVLRLDSLFAAAQQVPELAQAYVAFLAAVKPVEEFVQSE